MGTIVKMADHADKCPAKPRNHSDGTQAEIVLFSGVRIERGNVDLSADVNQAASSVQTTES